MARLSGEACRVLAQKLASSRERLLPPNSPLALLPLLL
jgi:hypothetical protein